MHLLRSRIDPGNLREDLQTVQVKRRWKSPGPVLGEGSEPQPATPGKVTAPSQSVPEESRGPWEGGAWDTEMLGLGM